MSENESPFACVMDAIPLEARSAHVATIEKLFSMVSEMRELPNGYRFTFPGESEIWTTASAFVALERLCCPFFEFGLEVECEYGSIHLCLTGREGVKPFIMSEIGHHLTQVGR